MKNKIVLEDRNRFLISELIKNGRVKYTDLAKKLNVTPAAIKERVERLIEHKIIRPSALLNSQEIFPVTGGIGIESDAEGINILVRKLRNCPLVIHMTKTSGNHNLVLSIVSEDFQQLESFLNNQIRSEPGIKHVEVNVGNESTIVPEFAHVRLFYDEDAELVPCGLRYDEREVCLNCPGLLNTKRSLAKVKI